ncbi:MAG: thiamine pyrophosphate-dependent enzyme [Methanomassiliicoccales archaeon]|nr:thiamine pyrophosphate-dependent enzyme [Methanomassiliicoccales archaeon]
MNGTKDIGKLTLRDVPNKDYFLWGHGACPGCGVAITVKNLMRIFGPETIVYVPASCLVVFGAQYPTSAFDVPYFFTAFENTGAVITGIRAALRRRGKKALVVGMAGDGGTFDIGLQALSGAADRNEDVMYVCLDNEAYMNTGIQMSGATPFGAWTTTSPAGKLIHGKRRFKKDIGSIVAAHDVPYMATLSIAHWNDFVRKAEKAKRAEGFRFLHVLTPCVPGWRSEQSRTMELARLAVETGMWTLYEVEHGEPSVTYKPKRMEPVTEYLKLQGRFAHMMPDDIDALQKWVCKKWWMHYKDEVEAPPCEMYKAEKPLAHDGDPLHGV